MLCPLRPDECPRKGSCLRQDAGPGGQGSLEFCAAQLRGDGRESGAVSGFLEDSREGRTPRADLERQRGENFPRPWEGTVHTSAWAGEAGSRLEETFRVPNPEKVLVLTPTPQRNMEQDLSSLLTLDFLVC